MAQETKTFVTPEQLSQVADAQKTYIDKQVEGVAVPEAADEGTISAIVNKFSVAD